MEKIITHCLTKYDDNLVEHIFDEIENYTVQNLNDVKALKKIKGDLFENFAKLYLKHIKEYEEVYLLKEVSDEIMEKMNLKRQDQGIDLIAIHKGKYVAIQAKFKAKKYKNLNWKVLSTFYALSAKAKFNSLIIITNCLTLKRVSNKLPNEKAYLLKTFLKLERKDLEKMVGLVSHKLGGENSIKNVEDVREARLKKFEIKNNIDVNKIIK